MDDKLNGTSGISGEEPPVIINDDPMGTSGLGLNGTSGLENNQ
jgi:hypothetical protein